MAVLKWVCVVILAAVIGAVVYCYINYTKLAEKHAMIYANYSGISLIGEEDVLRDPYKLADSIFEEAKKMWEVDPNGKDWFLESDSPGYLSIESKPVLGQFETAKIPIQRAFAYIKCNSSIELFKLMTSPEGYAIIDPITPIEEHLKPPLYSFPWKKGGKGRLEVVSAKIDFPPPMKRREFLVYNIIDEKARTFISKSISIDGYATNGTVRAINTFALQFEDLPEQCDARLGQCSSSQKNAGQSFLQSLPFMAKKAVGKGETLVLVKSYDYADILIDPVLTYYINADTFYQQLFDRMTKRLASL